jgi:hypothetical protein
LALAPKVANFFSQGVMQRLGEPGRVAEVLSAFVHEFGAMGSGWYHPILPVVALAVTLRFQRDRLGDVLLASIPVAMMAGYFCIFLITPFGVKWQLQTSLYRLIVQVWPGLLIALFAALRTPETMAVAVPSPAASAKTRKRAKA